MLISWPRSQLPCRKDVAWAPRTLSAQVSVLFQTAVIIPESCEGPAPSRGSPGCSARVPPTGIAKRVGSCRQTSIANNMSRRAGNCTVHR
jgi:hypothetical protein